MTSNDLHKQKIFKLWLYAYQTKARNKDQKEFRVKDEEGFRKNDKANLELRRRKV